MVQQKKDSLPASYFIVDCSGWFRIKKQARIRGKKFRKNRVALAGGNRSGIALAREE